MSSYSHWLLKSRKVLNSEEPDRLLSVFKDLTKRAEKRLVYYRLFIVILNTLVFILLPTQMITFPALAYGMMLIGWLYAIALVMFQTYFKLLIPEKLGWFIPLLDAVLLTMWIAATGGFESPFFVEYYLSIVGLAFTCSAFVVYSLSFCFIGLYAGLCLSFGGLASSQVIDLLFRCVIMLFAGGIGDLIVSESVALAVSKEKYQDRIKESERMKEIFRSVQDDLELAVEKRTFELAEANATLEAEIQKRVGIEDALKKSVADTERANRAKTEFLANVSHEIRTPLNAVLGFSELLVESPGCVESEMYASAVIKNGKLLAAVIGDILDLSKIENGAIHLERTDVEIRSLLSEVVDLYRLDAQAKGLLLVIEISADTPEAICADQTRLKQILVNLVSNAVKFTDRGSIVIRVETEMVGNSPLGIVRFSVTDSGVGIPEDRHRRIFDPFTQVDSSTSKKYGGTGLGLTISRVLAQKMGGDLILESSTIKHGSTFALTLPSSVCAIPVIKVPKEVSAASIAKKPLIGLRFLLVDDAPDNQVLLQHMLKSSGAEVVDLAVDGVGAIRLGSTNKYDVILMDLQMPRVDGFQATQALRRLGVQTPIIAVTAHAMTEVRDRVMNEGFSEFIAKPVVPRVLVSTILEVLDGDPLLLAAAEQAVDHRI